MTFENILISTITVFLVVGIGWFFRGIKVIDDAAEKSMMTLVINVLYPCFIFSKILGNDALQQSSVVVSSLAIGLAMIVTAFTICYGVGRMIGLNSKNGLNTFCVAAAIPNYGYLVIPMVERIFPGEQGDQILGVLFVHNLGLEIAIWTLGIVLISGSSAGAWRRVFNGPSIALTVGLLLNFTGLYTKVPEILYSVFAMLAPCAVPIGLVLVGSTVGNVLKRSKSKFSIRVVGAAIVVQFVLLSLLYAGVASMITFSDELRIVLLFMASMPCGIFPIVLARHYKGHPEIAVQTAISTSAVCLLLTPLWLTFWFWLLTTSVSPGAAAL